MVSLQDVIGIGTNVSIPMTTNDSVHDDEINVIDNNWIKSRFMSPGSELSPLDRQNRFFTSALFKFTDTTIGGNIGLNSRPQYTWYADIRHGGRFKRERVTVANNTGGFGMGRYYSEAIDDNATTIFLEFGIPRFNSLITFFTRAIDGVDSYIAKTGRMPSGIYNVGRMAGNILAFTFFPLVSTIIIAVKTLASLATASTGNQFNFYYFEAAMHMYWGSVNTILTMFATELGILIPILDDTQQKAGKIGFPGKFDQKDLNAMREAFPGLIKNGNYIDAYAIATRQQRIANAMMVAEYEMFKDGLESDTDFYGYVKKHDSINEYNAYGSRIIDSINSKISFDTYIGMVVNGGTLYKKEFPVDDNPATAKAAGQLAQGNSSQAQSEKISSNDVNNHPIRNQDGSYDFVRSQKEIEYDQTYIGVMDSVIRDGGLYLALNVDYQGSVSESFSNSIGEIGTKDAIKSVAKGVSDMRFNFAGGAISEAVDNAVNTAKSVVMGALEGVTFGFSNVVATVLGGGYIDIPKKWDDSSMDLPSITYKTRLISPYGNPISQIQNIYLPLSCLLAGVLPMGVGKASYTSPFLCTLFNKGVQNVRLGMITSLSIERGTSNLGYNKLKKALAIDVSFTVTDFSTLFTAPINRNIFENAFSPFMDDDMPLNQYIATVASRDIITNKYVMPKIKLYMSRKFMNIKQTINPNSFAFRTGETLNGLLGPFVHDRALGNSMSNTN